MTEDERKKNGTKNDRAPSLTNEQIIQMMDNISKTASATEDIKKDSHDSAVNSAKSCTILEDIQKNNQKFVFALIAVIAGQIGLKFAGTPLYVDVAIYLCLFSGTFLLASLVAWFKEFDWPQRSSRIFTSTLLITSAITQISIYQPGEEVPPDWFIPLINILMILMAVSMLWVGWKQRPRKRNGVCSGDRK